MIKKICSIALSLIMVMTSFAGLGDLFSYAAEDDVIEIYTVEDLYAINNNMSGNYKLMNDIDLSEATAVGGDYDYNGMGWKPIGIVDKYNNYGFFKGTFDGCGHKITGIRIDFVEGNSSVTKDYVGFFSCIDSSGKISNLFLEYDTLSVDLPSYRQGNSDPTYPTRCFVGAITAINLGIVEKCGCSVHVKIKENHGSSAIGGIAGVTIGPNAVVRECYTTGEIVYERSCYAGGIAGGNGTGFLADWDSTNNEGTISNCYNTAKINCLGNYIGTTVGGICGVTGSDTTYPVAPNNSYNIGEIAGGVGKGVANAYGTAYTNSYYLKGTGQASTKISATELSEAQMKEATSFVGFDFDNVWVIDSHSDYPYPQLRSNRMDNKDIDQVKVKTKPKLSKTDYWTGDAIDPTDGKITICYKNDTTKTIDMADYMFENTELTETGSQTVTGYYLGIPFTFTANVTARPEIRSLEVINEPTKKSFVKGTAFDFAGCVIRATYEDNTVIDVEPTAENTEGGNINNTGNQTISYSLDGKTASFDVTVIPVEPTSIKIATKPTRTSWVEGEDISLYGMVVSAKYNNGEEVTLKASDYEVSELPTTVGKHTVTITYGDLTAELQLNITTKELQSISVTTPPEISEYVIGQELDRSGMVVKAAYNNGKLVEIDDYTVSALPTEVGYGDVTIEWGGKKTTTQVKMIAKEVEKIKVATAPTKTTYINGEDIKTDGIKVVKVYNDKSEVEVDDYTLATKTASGTGSKNATIEWNGYTTTYKITVVEKTITGLLITPPTKTSYIDDEELDTDGMVVKAVYDSGKSYKLDEADYDIDGFEDVNHYGLVTVSYEGVSKSFYVYRHTSGEWQTTTDPKCEEKGEKTLYCSECKQAIATEEIEAKNHSFGAWETITSPKCEEKGCEQRECSVCHVKETRDIDEKQHQWDDDFTVDKEPKCTEEGSKSIHCKNCEAVKESTVIESLNHDEKTAITKATVDAAGRYLVTCDRCKETLVDKVIAKIDSIEFIDDEFIYNGDEQTPELIILDTNNHRLIADTDYTVDYSDNTEVGTAKAVISFDSNYDGTVVKKFTIKKAAEAYVIPTGLTAVYGQTLADIELTDNFSWMDDTLSVGKVGTNKFKVKYTPSDPKNKETIEDIEVSVLVTKAVPGYEKPEELKAVFGDTLRDVDLPDGWTWMDKSASVGNVGTKEFKAKFTPEDTDNYSVVKDVELDVTVEKAVPSYVVPENLGATYGQKLSDVELSENFTWNDDTLSVGNVGVKTFAATYTPTDQANFKTVDNVKISVVVDKATPTFDAPTGLKAAWGQTLKDVELPDRYQWLAASTSVGDVGTNNFLARYTPDDTDSYKVVSNVEVEIEVGKAIPSYEIPSGLEAVYGQKLSAVSLPDNFTWTDGTQSVGNVGEHKFTATYTPSDTDHYKAVEGVELTVDVKKAEPTYELPADLKAVYGQKLSDVILPSGFSWVDGTQSVGKAGTNSFKLMFTPDDEENYKIVKNISVDVEVSKATPEYIAPVNLVAVPGDKLKDIALAKGFTWQNGESEVGDVGSHEFMVTYTPDDKDNYKVVEDIPVTVAVAKLMPEYELPQNLTAVYGQKLSDVTLPDNFTWTDGTQSVGDVGVNTFKATYTPENTGRYEVKENIDISVRVTKATPEYEIPTGLQATYGDKLSSIDLPEGFTWMSPSNSVGKAGTNTFKLRYTPEDTSNYLAVSGIEVNVQVSKATPQYSIPKELTATYGDRLSTVSLPSGWSWASSTSSAVGNVGVNYFNAKFTPSDTSNYVEVSERIAVEVKKATPSYTAPTNLHAYCKQTLGDVKLPANYSWVNSSAPVGSAGNNIAYVNYVPDDIDNYKKISNIPVQVVVEKLTPSYSVPSGLSTTYGAVLSSIALPSGFSWESPNQSVGNAGSNTFTVKYTPADTSNYNVVYGINVTVAVNKANPSYSIPSGLTATCNSSLSSVGLSGGWSWSNSGQSVGTEGKRSFKATFTPSDTKNYNTISNIDVSVTVNHNWNSAYTTDTVSTCTVAGKKSIHCSGCNAIKSGSTVTEPLLSHTWAHHETPSGELVNGESYDKCSVCGTETEHVVIPGYSKSYVKSFKLAAGKNAFTAKWKKQSAANLKKFDGYQIRYSTDSEMADAIVKTVGKSKTSLKVAKLSKKTKYYVQIRTYTKGFYSEWTEKTVVTK